MDLKTYLQTVIDTKASDLHLISGLPPTYRINGDLAQVPGAGVLTSEQIEELLKQILTNEQIERLSVNKEIDFSLAFSEKGRFRVNAYTQKNTLAVAFRLIPSEVPSLDELGLPKIVHTFTTLRQGFILVTGPTGHGKSTTLASLINEINKTRSVHIVTIEDPVEFVFRPQKSIISQREMRSDTHSWEIALRSVLREDPDVVLVGEMRDHETISAALTVAETGHLVLATLHTNSAAQSVDRIVDVFPDEQQKQVRLQLSNTLEAVFSQRLIPTTANSRTVAYELMLGTTAIRTAIREGKTH
jgi:twitching motility protein PilT